MLFLMTAFAAEPVPLVDDGTLVHEVRWARPFTLTVPHPYRYTAEPREITKGWLVELVVEGWTMMPRQVGVPNVWIGDQVAGRLTWARKNDGPACAVVWVPGEHDLSKDPVFFGTTDLAERIDEAKRAAVSKAGAEIGPKKRGDVHGAVLELGEFTALHDVAQTRCR